jgi:hypothetical protein
MRGTLKKVLRKKIGLTHVCVDYLWNAAANHRLALGATELNLAVCPTRA